MTAKPFGVYRREGENGASECALVECGVLRFHIPEHKYREKGLEPAFEALPCETQYRSLKSRMNFCGKH